MILDLFRPFVVDRDTNRFAQLFDEGSISSPDAICAASIRRLKRLILLYQVYHEKSQPTMFWHVALLYLTNSIVKDSQDPDRQVYTVICICAYQRFKRSFVFGRRILQGLLFMAVDLGILSIAEAKVMASENEEPSGTKYNHRAGKTKNAGSSNEDGDDVDDNNNSSVVLMLDLDKGVHDQTSSRVDVMAQGFEEMKLFDQFTEGII